MIHKTLIIILFLLLSFVGAYGQGSGDALQLPDSYSGREVGCYTALVRSDVLEFTLRDTLNDGSQMVAASHPAAE